MSEKVTAAGWRKKWLPKLKRAAKQTQQEKLLAGAIPVTEATAPDVKQRMRKQKLELMLFNGILTNQTKQDSLLPQGLQKGQFTVEDLGSHHILLFAAAHGNLPIFKYLVEDYKYPNKKVTAADITEVIVDAAVLSGSQQLVNYINSRYAPTISDNIAATAAISGVNIPGASTVGTGNTEHLPISLAELIDVANDEHNEGTKDAYIKLLGNLIGMNKAKLAPAIRLIVEKRLPEMVNIKFRAQMNSAVPLKHGSVLPGAQETGLAITATQKYIFDAPAPEPVEPEPAPVPAVAPLGVVPSVGPVGLPVTPAEPTPTVTPTPEPEEPVLPLIPAEPITPIPAEPTPLVTPLVTPTPEPEEPVLPLIPAKPIAPIPAEPTPLVTPEPEEPVLPLIPAEPITPIPAEPTPLVTPLVTPTPEEPVLPLIPAEPITPIPAEPTPLVTPTPEEPVLPLIPAEPITLIPAEPTPLVTPLVTPTPEPEEPVLPLVPAEPITPIPAEPTPLMPVEFATIKIFIESTDAKDIARALVYLNCADLIKILMGKLDAKSVGELLLAFAKEGQGRQGDIELANLIGQLLLSSLCGAHIIQKGTFPNGTTATTGTPSTKGQELVEGLKELEQRMSRMAERLREEPTPSETPSEEVSPTPSTSDVSPTPSETPSPTPSETPTPSEDPPFNTIPNYKFQDAIAISAADLAKYPQDALLRLARQMKIHECDKEPKGKLCREIAQKLIYAHSDELPPIPKSQCGAYTRTVKPEVIKKRQADIYDAWSKYANNVATISSKELKDLFKEYDEDWFNGKITNYMRDANYKLEFKTAGTDTFTTEGICGLNVCNYTITIPIQFFSNVSPTERTLVAGFPCKDQLECLMRVMEHEITHLIIFMFCRDNYVADQHGQLFLNTAKNLFGHTDYKHYIF